MIENVRVFDGVIDGLSDTTNILIEQALDAGVKSIEHGQLLDRATLQPMADEGAWLSFQPFTQCNEPNLNALQNEKQAIVCKGTAEVYKMMKEMPDLKVVHSTDVFLDPVGGHARQYQTDGADAGLVQAR